MQLNYLKIGRKDIEFSVSVNVESTDSTEERKITAHEAPLIELTNAFSKLSKVFCTIMELPDDYAEGLSVIRLGVSYTKSGTRSVKFKATKQLDCRRDFLHTIESPMVQIDKPDDGESGEVQVDNNHLTAITTAIIEAERYAKGERSQQLLNFDDGALQATVNIGKEDLLNGV